MAVEFQLVSRPIPKWAVDKIESGWATIENGKETQTLPASSLPEGLKVGDTLYKQKSKWFIDVDETKNRAKRISERFNRLKNK